MKKITTIITVVFLISISNGLFSQIIDSSRFYYAKGIPHFYCDDSTSINIIVSNLSNYQNIVSNLHKVFTSPKDEILSSIEDDNIIVNSDTLSNINIDSLKKHICIENNDISFISYKKKVNNNFIWLRNEIYVKLIDSLYYPYLLTKLQNYVDYQIINEENNTFKIIFKNEQSMISAANSIFDTTKVKYSTPDFYSNYKTSTIYDPFFNLQWGLNNNYLYYGDYDISATETWNFLQSYMGNYGSDIVIAVIDDGVEPHEDFYLPNGVSRVLDGYTCSLFGIGSGRPLEDGKHGQVCAGIIAASINHIGIAGVAPNSKIVPIRIFKEKGVPFSDRRISRGIYKAWNEYNASILSLSWGLHNGESDLVSDAINEAITYGRSGRGCIVVAASGNYNYDEVDFPSSIDGVISVGAVDRCSIRAGEYEHIIAEAEPCDSWVEDQNFQLASNYGDNLSVVAPGSNIVSTDRMGNLGYNEEGNYYEHCWGTSLATPHVAGVAALILSVNLNLSSTEVKNIIESTTNKFYYEYNETKQNGFWDNKVGYGLVNALRCVGKAIYNNTQIIGESELTPCNLYSFYCNINNSNLFTFSWGTSSNMLVSRQDNNFTNIIPISSGNGIIYVSVYYQGNLIYKCTKNVFIDGNANSTVIPLSSSQLNITSDLTLNNNNHLLYTNLFVNSGAILTITGSVFCTENAKIIVEPGGKLIIDGGTIKNYCSTKPWQGIEVKGNSLFSQNATNQGIVILNGAVIENAVCGIKVGDQSDLSKNGGIVYATNTTFKNCKNAVLFAPYKNMNNNIEFANRSKFTECNFLVNNDFYTSGMFFDSHVKLLGVNGISFTGCSFINTQTNLNPSVRRYASSGISAINSGFSVQPKCFSNVASGEVCAIPYVDVPSVFSGLDYGIVIQDAGTMNQVKISSTQFSNNYFGVYVSGLDNVKLLNNDFTVGKSSPNFISNPCGVYFKNASNFRIEENRFSKYSNFQGLPFGLQIKSSGIDNNVVYKNQFFDLEIAQNFVGANYWRPLPHEGLKSLCNEHESINKYDIYVTKDPNSRVNGINMYQNMTYNLNGIDQTVAAGNKFTPDQTLDLQYNNDANFLFYYYNQNNPIEILTDYSTTTIHPDIAPENPCFSKLFGFYPSTINAQLSNITYNYGNLKYNYNQLIDAGNTHDLIDLIQGEWSEDVWELRTELLGQSPYLSQEALYSVALKNLLPPALFLEICLANPDATKSEEFLEKLRTVIPNPLPEYMINLIRASWNQKTLRTELEEELSAFKTYRDEYQNYKTEILFSDTIYNYTDIINHLGSRGSYGDYFSLAEIAISQEDFVQANLYLDIFENNNGKLSEEEAAEIASFRDYISIRETIFLDSTNIYNLDSIQIAALEIYASSNNYRGAILARNILCFLYNICIDDVPAPPKMLRVGSTSNSGKNATPYIASVKVLPNPANTYVSFIWDMKSYNQSAILYIYDQTGKTVMTKEIENPQGQWIWDLKNTPSGVYVYTLKSDQLILFSGKVIVNK